MQSGSLGIETWANVRQKLFAAEYEEGTHPDHLQEVAGRAKNILGRNDARDVLRKIWTFDGHVQC